MAPHLARTLPNGSGLPSGGSGPAVYDAKLQGPPRAPAALLGRACLEMLNPRVEIGIDGAIHPESASNSPTKLS
jgi:hypothetical protein